MIFASDFQYNLLQIKKKEKKKKKKRKKKEKKKKYLSLGLFDSTLRTTGPS